MKAYIRKKAPKYVKSQESRAKTGIRKIYKGLHKILVIDDENYGMVGPHDIPGRSSYHAADPDDVDYSLKTKLASKFPEKFLASQAIYENGNVSSL